MKGNPQVMTALQEALNLEAGLMQQYKANWRDAKRFGLDLAGLREYQLHDDVRHIDWNVTARLHVPYVRQYNEDREITAWFLLDMSPSMDFGSGEINKRHILTEFTGIIARLLTRHGNRVGALIYGGGLDTIITASSGRRHVLQILDALTNRPELPRSPPTDLSDFLRAALQIAIENPQASVTFLDYSCSGASIAQGILGPQTYVERVASTERSAQLAAPMIAGEVQPHVCPRLMASSSNVAPRPSVTDPRTSNFTFFMRVVCGKSRHATNEATSSNGVWMMKIILHPMESTSGPPSTTPSTGAPAVVVTRSVPTRWPLLSGATSGSVRSKIGRAHV